MISRPIYRWKSFWLGLLMICIFGSMWSWSLSHYRATWFHQGATRWQINFTVGKVTIEKMKWVPGSVPSKVFGSVSTRVPAAGWLPLPPAFERDPWKRSGDIGYPTWAVAHWFIALLFLVPWSACIAWRWRRMRRSEPKLD